MANVSLSFGRDAYAFYLALSHQDHRQRIADCVGSIGQIKRSQLLKELEMICPISKLREDQKDPLGIEKILGRSTKYSPLLRFEIERHARTRNE